MRNEEQCVVRNEGAMHNSYSSASVDRQLEVVTLYLLIGVMLLS